MRHVLVTGATGFIGIHLVPALLEDGYVVYALTRKIPDAPIEGVIYVEADLATALPDDFLKNVQIDTLIDLAALIPGATYESEYAEISSLFSVNVLGHLALVSHLPSLKRIVYASTIDVYGSMQAERYTEEHPTNPGTYYGVTKLALEKAYVVYAHAHALSLSILRLSQVYGRGDAEVKIIPKWIHAVREEAPVVLMDEGRSRRSYIHVEDVVRAFLCALTQERAGIYNITGPAPTSIADTLSTIEKVLGKTTAHTGAPGKSADMVMDGSKAEKELGFTAHIGLAEGIQKTL